MLQLRHIKASLITSRFQNCMRKSLKSNSRFTSSCTHRLSPSSAAHQPYHSRRIQPPQDKIQRLPKLSIHARNMSRTAIEPQRVDAPLTKSATFLVLTINNPDNPKALDTVRSTLSSIDDLSKNVSIRDLQAQFACTVGIGSNIWDQLTSWPRPAELHPFKEIKGKVHTAVSTPGDLLFHIRSDRRDINFEFEKQLLTLLGNTVTVVDETIGFRYFDVRDLLGFVDGTANPVGNAIPESVFIAEKEDASGIGGSYVVIQKYLHDMTAWQALPTHTQESIIGRTKFDNIELSDADEGKQQAHKSLATIEQDGSEFSILRDNMPFGSPGSGEFGTYFIGYSKRLWVVEKMVERMFVGVPEGMHDRLLDFSRAVTGGVFFVPAAGRLAELGD